MKDNLVYKEIYCKDEHLATTIPKIVTHTKDYLN
jgi:hypothetical protein